MVATVLAPVVRFVYKWVWPQWRTFRSAKCTGRMASILTGGFCSSDTARISLQISMTSGCVRALVTDGAFKQAVDYERAERDVNELIEEHEGFEPYADDMLAVGETAWKYPGFLRRLQQCKS